MNTFSAFGWAHFGPLFLSAIAGFYLIPWVRQQSTKLQVSLGFYLSLILPALITFDVVSELILGTFDITEDLPLHMCRLVTFILPLMILGQKRRLFGVLYFWVLAGTTQAILTPDIQMGFPSYEYIRYWILHLLLVFLIIYSLIIFKFRPQKKDLWLAVLWAQVYLVCTLPINWWLDANYGYTMHKPSVGSIADYMGEWPWYILTGELIMLTFFLLLYLPFGITGWRKSIT